MKWDKHKMIPVPEIFTTPRLILRRSRLDDAEAVFEYASDPQVIHYMDYRPRTDINDVVNDISEQMVAFAQQKNNAFPNVSFQIANASSLPFADKNFDVVVSANGFHIPKK